MTGNEIITITIEGEEKTISTSYNILNADYFNLMVLDDLIERFKSDKQQKHSIMKA